MARIQPGVTSFKSTDAGLAALVSAGGVIQDPTFWGSDRAAGPLFEWRTFRKRFHEEADA